MERSQRGLVLVRQCSSSPGTCSTEETGLHALPCFDYPPNSPDLAPTGYQLFPGLKKQLNGHHFLSNAKVIAASETWFEGQSSEFFLSGL
jgi:hypothetical protein